MHALSVSSPTTEHRLGHSPSVPLWSIDWAVQYYRNTWISGGRNVYNWSLPLWLPAVASWSTTQSTTGRAKRTHWNTIAADGEGAAAPPSFTVPMYCCAASLICLNVISGCRKHTFIIQHAHYIINILTGEKRCIFQPHTDALMHIYILYTL